MKQNAWKPIHISGRSADVLLPNLWLWINGGEVPHVNQPWKWQQLNAMFALPMHVRNTCDFSVGFLLHTYRPNKRPQKILRYEIYTVILAIYILIASVDFNFLILIVFMKVLSVIHWHTDRRSNNISEGKWLLLLTLNKSSDLCNKSFQTSFAMSLSVRKVKVLCSAAGCWSCTVHRPVIIPNYDMRAYD
jgi:hypothetical protein